MLSIPRKWVTLSLNLEKLILDCDLQAKSFHSSTDLTFGPAPMTRHVHSNTEVATPPRLPLWISALSQPEFA